MHPQSFAAHYDKRACVGDVTKVTGGDVYVCARIQRGESCPQEFYANVRMLPREDSGKFALISAGRGLGPEDFEYLRG
jgi:hypothetical protein